MLVREITEFLSLEFPVEIQEPYDNSGRQVLFGDNKVSSILFSLDFDNDVLAEAVENGCNLIIAHHPFFFKPIKNINSGEPDSDLLIRLISEKISLYCVHTNLDKIFYDKLASVIGLKDGDVLIKSGLLDDGREYGLGYLSKLENGIRLGLLLKMIKESLGNEFIIYSGDMERKVYSIAVINGSGAGFIDKITSENMIDCLITGDAGYHHAKSAIKNSVALIDAGHFATERILLSFLKERVQDFLTKKALGKEVVLYISGKEINPFKLYS